MNGNIKRDQTRPKFKKVRDFAVAISDRDSITDMNIVTDTEGNTYAEFVTGFHPSQKRYRIQVGEVKQ